MSGRTRTLSYSEISTALTCSARWDFAYGGRLAGDTLRQRQLSPLLSDGRAWGAAVAVWHSMQGSLFAEANAMLALQRSLAESAEKQAELGFTVEPDRMIAKLDELEPILTHYAASVEQLPGLELIEDEINVSLLSRNSQRASSRYRYQAYIDGHTERKGHPWIVEFKLRGQLVSQKVLEKMPQFRWYAWAWARRLGWAGPVGVYVDERLKQAPKPPKILKDGRVSSDRQQHTTAELYMAACEERGQVIDSEVTDSLHARRWNQRTPLLFTPDQLAEAGRELASAAQTIRDLDSGVQWPVRNGSPTACRMCRYEPICIEPRNSFVVNALYERRTPKRFLSSVADQ